MSGIPGFSGERMERYRADPVAFLEEHYICRNAHTGKDVLVRLEPWQANLVHDVLCTRDPATGLRQYNMAVIALAKKNGKSELGAMIATWYAICGEREGEIVIAANDREQAATITFLRIARAIRKNPVLAKECKVCRQFIEVKSTGTVVRAIARDAASAAGNSANCTVFDELWGLRDREFFDELTQNPIRRDPMTLVTTYAGFDRASVLHEIYEQGRAGADPHMYFHWPEGEEAANPASWVTQAYLDQQRLRLPAQVFRRLHCNEWSTPDEPFVEPWQIERCTTGRQNAAGAKGEWPYVLTCDLGLTRDRAAVAVLHRDGARGKVVLDDLAVWEGRRERPVRIADVADALEARYRRFGPRACVFDAWEMRPFIQAHAAWPTVEFAFQGAPMHEMAQALYRAVAEGQLELYPQAGRFRGRDGLWHDLQGELAGLVLVETPGGYKFDHRSGRHNDMSIALGMGMWQLLQKPTGVPLWRRMLVAELAVDGQGALTMNAQWAEYARLAGVDPREVVRGMRGGRKA